MSPTTVVRLQHRDAAAEIALLGAEPMSWSVGGRDLLWSGDPAHWAFRAPILFPVVGASTDGAVLVEGRSYPMPQHGFARRLPFRLVDQAESAARLRLVESAETLVHYPFPFRLDVVVTLAPASLALSFEVMNTGESVTPYGIGFHPAFRWPFDAPGRAGHRIVFAEAERPDAPEVAAGGLLSRATRRLPLAGRELALAPELFTEALVFLDARSRSFAFASPTGAAIEMAVEGFPHLAAWTKPDAPFLSLEAWSAHADWEDADGDLMRRPSMRHLAPGKTGQHRVTLTWRDAA